MTTAIILKDEFWKHDTGYYHPENSNRLTSIKKILYSTSYFKELQVLDCNLATKEHLSLIHTKEHIENFFRKTSTQKSGQFDGDTIFSEGTKDAALLAVGAGIKLADSILDGKIQNGIALVRPPGHHAENDRAMGFCMFNNVAITAKYLQTKGIGKVLILDWDVHHGNGTENSFYEDDSVYYMSLHQYPFYPGTGAKEDRGSGKGNGYNLNIPLQRGCGDSDYLKAFDFTILKEIDRFQPEFILISAGFDAHKNDPLGGMELSTSAFERFTEILKKKALEYSNGRIISFLEGGYDLDALAESVEVHLSVLKG